MQENTLKDYHLAHAALADLHRRLGMWMPPSDYQRALALTSQPAEQHSPRASGWLPVFLSDLFALCGKKVFCASLSKSRGPVRFLDTPNQGETT